jgi:5-methylcytosine-specific restriction endonuclease McrA
MFRKPVKYPVEEIMDEIDDIGRFRGILDGEKITIKSKKFKNFKLHGTRCVSCGLEGKYFVQEKPNNHEYYHLELYGTKFGREVLMTRDHIKPVSKRGHDTMENSQTMCFDCNSSKSNIDDDKFKVVKRYKLVRNVARILPTIVSFIVGILLLHYKIYTFGCIFAFLGTYPVAHIFSVKFSKGMKNLFKIDLYVK